MNGFLFLAERGLGAHLSVLIGFEKDSVLSKGYDRAVAVQSEAERIILMCNGVRTKKVAGRFKK